MGIAAYNRGSEQLSQSISRQFGPVPGDYPAPESVPRPPEWGSKTRTRALKRAQGYLNYCASRGRKVTSEELVDMLHYSEKLCGKSTAQDIADELLTVLDI